MRKDKGLEELKKKRHVMAGQVVKVEEGPFKGQYFKVLDYIVNQYQGKDIEKLAEVQAQLITPVVGRGYPLDDKIVFGQLYPKMEHICVHDNELKIKKVQPPLKVVEDEKETQDDTGKSSEGNSDAVGTGPAEPNGRAVSSEDNVREIKPTGKRTGKKD